MRDVEAQVKSTTRRLSRSTYEQETVDLNDTVSVEMFSEGSKENSQLSPCYGFTGYPPPNGEDVIDGNKSRIVLNPNLSENHLLNPSDI